MAGLAVLRRASGLSDAYRPRGQGKVFEQAVLGKTPSLFRALPHASARRRGTREQACCSIFRNSSRNDHERHQESGRAVRKQ